MSILQVVAKCTPMEWQVPLELEPLSSGSNDKGLWIDPVAFIQVLNGWALAEWAIRTAQRLQFWVLPKPRGPGAPVVYRDESVLLTSLVAAAWRLSFERITDWLTRYEALAETLGYEQFDDLGRRRTISLAQYSRRLKALGLLPYFLIFIALVAALLKMGLIEGQVVPLPTDEVVPHMGWNLVELPAEMDLFSDLGAAKHFYFAHSYHAQISDAQAKVARTDYGFALAASVQKGNVYGAQFHPEKSGKQGLKVLQNFYDICNRNASTC